MDRPLKPAGLAASPAQSRGDALSHGLTAGTLLEEPTAPTAIAPCPPKGGPRTLEGKARSRTNALRHGLTATTLINAVLPANRVNELRADLSAEIGPRTVIERLLVDEVARHAAMLELGERAELAVLRHGAAGLATFGIDALQSEDPDAVLAAAVASDAVDKFSRAAFLGIVWPAALGHRIDVSAGAILLAASIAGGVLLLAGESLATRRSASLNSGEKRVAFLVPRG
jgi:hypothetical protein